ncbi:GTP 3',8-cyclase MoaA [Acetobacter sp. AN02]|uniref:GTP 3',8-cyclase MoaA n=1 Tax=Acetobacter sp. AN02 TaxID=2894186 RepID=UPI00243420E4|nr:GTP 3',8-cyclase MoaA [Acetobacter sp. AN02]MDG6095556.1 GTP 3',8-cyclase MoaA [Acetobacter sp. AN02]
MASLLTDSFGRAVTYLRLSVTDRCDMRCLYCMAENMTFLPREDMLGGEEMQRVAEAFIRSGVRRIRLTGGEPLVRHETLPLIRRLGAWLDRPEGMPGLDEITLTTNGSRLRDNAGALYEAGVRRINVSLDSLRPERFREITRRGNLDQVLDGIRAAREAGLALRINTVAMAGTNDDETDELIRYCGKIGADLCLIETMPMGETGDDRRNRYLPLTELRRDLETRWTLEPLTWRTGGPARYVRVGETGRRLGFITPLTHNFCEGCNRVRLSCTGRLYTCLGQEDGGDLRAVLRAGGSDQDLLAAIGEAIRHKPRGHDFVLDRDTDVISGPQRHMSVTGG